MPIPQAVIKLQWHIYANDSLKVVSVGNNKEHKALVVYVLRSTCPLACGTGWLIYFQTWLHSQVHSSHSSASLLTPSVFLICWNKHLMGADQRRAVTCKGVYCMCVCGNLCVWWFTDECRELAAPHYMLARPFLQGVRVQVCVSLRVLARLWEGISFTWGDRWPRFMACYRNRPRLPLLWEPIKGQYGLAYTHTVITVVTL